MTASQPAPLTTSLTSLRGVGAQRAAQLARLNLQTVNDLLMHRPRRYEDRRRLRAISELAPEEPSVVRGKVVAMGVKRWRRGQNSVFELILEDGTGRLHCRWWNLPFMEKYFHQGDEVFVYGKLLSLKPRTIDHPETEVVEAEEGNSPHLNRIVPVYPLTEGLPQRWLRSLTRTALDVYGAQIGDLWPRGDGVWRERAEPGLRTFVDRLIPRSQAIEQIHFPTELSEVESARQRLALDEFVELQQLLLARRRRLQTGARPLPCGGTNRLIRPFLRQLGFVLTDAQTRVLREIRRDLGGRQPMRRLLQGDVGSGKTVVAACAALMAIESGYHSTLMAPTEILAEQHFQTFERWFRPLGIDVRLRTGNRISGSAGEAEKASPSSTAPSSPVLTIGTHALIEAPVQLEKLGLVIIDEQHKFGVAQRERLLRKGRYPHLLVMTATPIPRTLGLTLYGDLDSSVIDQSPAGRGRIKTFVRPSEKLSKVWEFIRGKLAEGRQAYVVYPRIEESDGPGVKAVTGEWKKLSDVFAPREVGLLHGRLGSAAKKLVMQRFRDGHISVLVATSVIEVGVDVSNATVMVIENAEQFGLAQLHQLRGRIGRGAHESYCVLVTETGTDEARQRLRVMEETSDGFRIAEEDLKLRGAGELLGRQQSGLPPFIFGDLARDRELIEQARRIAELLPEHSRPK